MANILEGRFWPKKGKINRYEAQIFSVATWRQNLDFLYSDYNFSASTTAIFKTLEEIELGFEKRFVFLTDEFEPTGKDGALALPANTGYHFNNVGLRFESDQRKLFSFRVSPTYGEFFNGDRFSIESGFNLRFQPKVEIGLNIRNLRAI